MKRKSITSALSLLAATAALIGLAHGQTKKRNIIVIWGDDIGIQNISYNSHGS